jgi:hypothetical protein
MTPFCADCDIDMIKLFAHDKEIGYVCPICGRAELYVDTEKIELYNKYKVLKERLEEWLLRDEYISYEEIEKTINEL